MNDKYELSSSNFDGKQSIRQVNMARIADSTITNPVLGEVPRLIRNLWMEINIKNFGLTRTL